MEQTGSNDGSASKNNVERDAPSSYLPQEEPTMECSSEPQQWSPPPEFSCPNEDSSNSGSAGSSLQAGEFPLVTNKINLDVVSHDAAGAAVSPAPADSHRRNDGPAEQPTIPPIIRSVDLRDDFEPIKIPIPSPTPDESVRSGDITEDPELIPQLNGATLLPASTDLQQPFSAQFDQPRALPVDQGSQSSRVRAGVEEPQYRANESEPASPAEVDSKPVEELVERLSRLKERYNSRGQGNTGNVGRTSTQHGLNGVPSSAATYKGTRRHNLNDARLNKPKRTPLEMNVDIPLMNLPDLGSLLHESTLLGEEPIENNVFENEGDREYTQQAITAEDADLRSLRPPLPLLGPHPAVVDQLVSIVHTNKNWLCNEIIPGDHNDFEGKKKPDFAPCYYPAVGNNFAKVNSEDSSSQSQEEESLEKSSSNSRTSIGVTRSVDVHSRVPTPSLSTVSPRNLIEILPKLFQQRVSTTFFNNAIDISGIMVNHTLKLVIVFTNGYPPSEFVNILPRDYRISYEHKNNLRVPELLLGPGTPIAHGEFNVILSKERTGKPGDYEEMGYTTNTLFIRAKDLTREGYTDNKAYAVLSLSPAHLLKNNGLLGLLKQRFGLTDEDWKSIWSRSPVNGINRKQLLIKLRGYINELMFESTSQKIRIHLQQGKNQIAVLSVICVGFDLYKRHDGTSSFCSEHLLLKLDYSTVSSVCANETFIQLNTVKADRSQELPINKIRQIASGDDVNTLRQETTTMMCLREELQLEDIDYDFTHKYLKRGIIVSSQTRPFSQGHSGTVLYHPRRNNDMIEAVGSLVSQFSAKIDGIWTQFYVFSPICAQIQDIQFDMAARSCLETRDIQLIGSDAHCVIAQHSEVNTATEAASVAEAVSHRSILRKGPSMSSNPPKHIRFDTGYGPEETTSIPTYNRNRRTLGDTPLPSFTSESL